MLVDDGHVGGEEGGGSGFYKFENLFSAWSLGAVRRGMDGGRGGEIVKEDAAETSALAAVGDGEIPVALLLKVGPVALVVLVAGVLERLVEMDGVGLVEVGRGEVGPAAKPPRFRFPGLGIFNLKVPVVEMDGGHVWVPGVDDDAEAGCEEGDGAGGLRQARVVRQHGHLGLGRELAVHDGDVDAGLFKDASVGEDAGGAFAAFGADPGVAEKGGRGGRRGELVGRGGGLDLFHRADDVVLQRLDPRGHADAHRVLRGVSDGAESGGLPLGRRFRGRRRGATGARASRWRRRRARRRSGRCPGRCEQLRDGDGRTYVSAAAPCELEREAGDEAGGGAGGEGAGRAGGARGVEPRGGGGERAKAGGEAGGDPGRHTGWGGESDGRREYIQRGEEIAGR